MIHLVIVELIRLCKTHEVLDLIGVNFVKNYSILIGRPEISFANISKHSMLISNGCYTLYNYNKCDKFPDT